MERGRGRRWRDKIGLNGDIGCSSAIQIIARLTPRSPKRGYDSVVRDTAVLDLPGNHPTLSFTVIGQGENAVRGVLLEIKSSCRHRKAELR
jgi:hypothetical protein